MRMIWKGTTLAGFGKKGEIVVAWYCKEPAAIKEKTKARANIGASCIDDASKRNTCFAKMALKAINGYRKTHDAPDLGEDNDKSGAL